MQFGSYKSLDLGFTLIEVLVAMSILAIGTMAVLAATQGYLRQLQGQSDHVLASMVLHNLIESQTIELELNQLGTGTQQGTAPMGNREWAWQSQVQQDSEFWLSVHVAVGHDFENRIVEQTRYIAIVR